MEFAFDDMSIEGANVVSKERKDGTFELIVGAYDVLSSQGAFYAMTDNVRKVFAQGELFSNSITEGHVLSEDEHPSMKANETIEDFSNRFRTINKENVCCRFISVDIDVQPTKVAFQQQPVYLVRAIIKPTESNGGISLRNDLLDETKDVAFSLRGFSNRWMVNGVLYKETYFVVTYDRVPNPGIPVARQSQWLNFDVESSEKILTDAEKMKLLTVCDSVIASDTESNEDKTYYKMMRGALTGCDDQSCVYNNW